MTMLQNLVTYLVPVLAVLITYSQSEGQMQNSEDGVYVYVLGFMNISMDKPEMKGFQQIMISSSADATARIQIPYVGLDEYISLTASNGRTYARMIKTDLVTAKGEGPRRKGVRITSTSKLSIQAVKAKSATGDGFLALPVTTNANEFFIMSATPTPEEHSVFLVAALFPDTCLEAYAVNGGVYRKIRGLIQLQEFDIYQMESDTDDLTGVYINSSKPIAVFGGHECLEEPSYTHFCDHSVIQVPPLAEWGTKYVVPPMKGRLPKAGYSVRVLSSKRSNSVQISSTSQRRTLDRGSYIHANITDSQATTVVTCSKPCLVTQYSRSWKHVTGDVKTDAFMTLIPPLDRYTKEMSFGTAKFYDKTYGQAFDYKENYVSIIARNTILNNIVLDGRPVPGEWRKVNKATSCTTVPIRKGFHRLSLSGSSSEAIMGFVYGHAVQVPSAYGYPAGYKLNGELVRLQWNETPRPKPNATLKDCRVNTDGARAPDLVYHLQVQLRKRARYDCASKYMDHLSERLQALKDYINKLICNGVICKQLSGTAVKSLEKTWTRYGVDITGMDVDIIMTTSLDDGIGDMYKCRKSVLQTISSATLWKLPKAYDGCEVLDFSALLPRSGSDGIHKGQLKWRGCR